VHALPLSDQRRLVAWLELAKGRTQVVSTTSAPLLPLVNAGQFIATLFYRLNTVCVDVTRLDLQSS
jgi:DNA-binding NtrC family response regulator